MSAAEAELEFAENFAERGARRMAAALPAVIDDFRPDLVLRDETDLGSTIAAGVLADDALARRCQDVARKVQGLPDVRTTVALLEEAAG